MSTLTDTVSFCATALSVSREAGQRHHDLSLSLLSQVNTMEVPQDFRDLIELFNKHRMDYMVVGSYALGFPGFTGLCQRRSQGVSRTVQRADSD